MVKGLISLGLDSTRKIIITCNERCKNLKLSFKFLRFKHDTLGGSTDQITHVGFSKGCGLSEEVVFANGIPSTIGDHICPMENGDPIVCPFGSCDMADSTALSSKAVANVQTAIGSKFIVPSLFSKTKWVERHLTDAEVLSVMDTPVKVTKAVNESDTKINLKEKADLVGKMIPLKTLQEVGRILFKFDLPKQREHTIPIYDVMRLGPGISGLDAIYDQIDQAKAAKNDDAAINTHLWDDAVFEKKKSDIDLSTELEGIGLGVDLPQLRERKLALDAIRVCHSNRYKRNVSRSFSNYM